MSKPGDKDWAIMILKKRHAEIEVKKALIEKLKADIEEIQFDICTIKESFEEEK